MPEVGVEPTRAEAHWILSPARLPIPPLRHCYNNKQTFLIYQALLVFFFIEYNYIIVNKKEIRQNQK